jgi:4-hydroxyphenylpyruvate dioxygenase-like putative hemolysin
MESRLSHVALLVPSADTSAKVLNSCGIETGEAEVFDSEGTKEIYIGSYDSQNGLLLLVESISDGPYKRAMTKRGPSLHHLAIDVRNVEQCVSTAQSLGWMLHPVSTQTMTHKTAWLYRKGLPTLIEVHQKKELASKLLQVSKIEIPISLQDEILFAGIGLGEIVKRGGELFLTVDGHRLSFAQIAGLK